MNAFLGVVVTLLVLVTPALAWAQDADALRKELEALKRQQEQYQKAIESLSERLQRLEAAPKPAPAPSPPVVQVPGAPSTETSPAPTTPPTAMDLIRPRQPFALYQQRGSGQLLFDMGVTGDFVGSLTQRNVQKANGGTFAGRENRFFPREVEVNLFGQIDPYARADVRIEAGEEVPGGETAVSLAEATITLLALPYGTQAKLGQMRNRFGWSNVVHEHDLPWIDRPDVYRMFFGEEGLAEKGGEATWVPDFLPFYLELLAGVFNGDNETAFGFGRLTDPLLTGRAQAYFDLTDTSAIQIGASVASGETPDRLRSTFLGFDAKYKYRPEGWLHPLLTLGTEGIYSIRRVEIGADTGVFDKRTRDRFGWYGWAELQPWRQWAVGARYDATQYPVNPGWQWAIEPYITFLPSEFLRFRVGYKHTDRDHRDGFDLNGGSARTVDELLFQATFIMGAHPAHRF
jgi:opacity protein-like surface antigen